MALKGVKVLEFAGLAPAPFCGKILSDFGATVTRIDKTYESHLDVLTAGKQTLGVNLKDAKGQELVRKLASNYDVVVEPFRPGIMEKLNLGPEILCKDNPRLIYARLTGFGQTGPLAARAGHDINYLAYSGVLSMLRYKNRPPVAPLNLLADFTGGSLMCAFGICLALVERARSGRGQVVDAAMVDGAAYVASWLFTSRRLHFWDVKLFEGGCYFYDIYETKDGKFMSVGPIEPQFFDIFKNQLGQPDLPQFIVDEDEKKKTKELITKIFREKTQAEWISVFNNIDACVYPVVEWEEVMDHEHNKERKTFENIDGLLYPKPAPRLSRTPGELKKPTEPNPIDEAISILKDIKMGSNEIKELVKNGVLCLPNNHSKL